MDDGPGIRSVVFFKGCPLSCVWCHNPESQGVKSEISFSPEECIGCNACIEACKSQALSRDNRFYIDREKCDCCFDCLPVCPSRALERVGREMTIQQIVEELAKDKIFFDTSGGGVTFSGGEPTLYMPFLSNLIQSVSQAGIHTLLETCGFFDWDKFESLILSRIHTIYFDLKLADPMDHKTHCGVSNDKILANFSKLAVLGSKGELDLLPRVPLVPGITATTHNLSAIAALLRANKIPRVSLLEYNPLWTDKSAKIGKENPVSDNSGLTDWMPRDAVLPMEKIFKDHGIEIIK